MDPIRADLTSHRAGTHGRSLALPPDSDDGEGGRGRTAPPAPGSPSGHGRMSFAVANCSGKSTAASPADCPTSENWKMNVGTAFHW